jgi:hypothetical protein
VKGIEGRKVLYVGMGSDLLDYYVVGCGAGFCGRSGNSGMDSKDSVFDFPSFVCSVVDF